MTKRITPTDVEDRMESAARTLRRLPNPPGSTPRGYGSGWPEYVQEPGAYGYNETRVRVVPSPRDIKEMEECFEWLALVAPGDARIVWLRAEGRRWRHIGIRMGCVRQTAWRRWAAALVTISKKLNARGRALNAAGGAGKTRGLERGGGAPKESAALNAAGVPMQEALALNAAGVPMHGAGEEDPEGAA